MTKKRIRITDGGIALPLGNNTFLMKGRLHSQGGIGIGNGGKNDIEVEDGEVVKFNKDNIQVLSDQPMLNGISPANALLAGGNFNKIFKAQQSINGNNHGSYAKDGVVKRIINYIFGDDEKENNEKAEPLNLEELKLRQAYAESGFDSEAKSNKDAMGLFQIRQILLNDYNAANGTNYTLEDLKDDKLNMAIRDWKMDKNLTSDWAVKNAAPDSVVYAKALGGYNMGNTSFIKGLEKAKADGIDIYNSMDWIDKKYLPKETVDYINFILRNQNNSFTRNQIAYESSKKKNSDKVEGIRKGFKEGGIKQFNDNTSINYHINDKGSISLKDADNYGYALDWIANWLSKRYSQLDKNERDYNRDDFLFSHDFGLIDVGQYAYDRNMKNMLSTPVIIDERYKNLYKNIDINKTYTYNDFPYIKDIMESNYTYGDKKRNIDDVKSILNYTERGHFKPFGKHIYLAPYPDETILIHELTHSFGLPQKSLISDNKKLKENIEQDSYLDSSNEIYSRLMEFRKANNIDPEHKYTKEDLQKLKENAKDFNLLNRYTDDTILYLLNDIAKNNNDNKNNNNNVFYAKNGGQINMKLKNKNKQDITDIVMNEILPSSTGKRKRFDNGGVWGATEWNLLGNTGLNFLSGILQGTIGSINANKVRKMYDDMKRTSTYIPVAREHINTKVDVEPQLSTTKLAEQKLINNAQANTSNSKVARQQAREAILNRISTDNQIYGDKFNKETNLRNAEAELQTQYNLVDSQNKIADIREQNEFDMMKAMGKANTGTGETQTWGTAIANSFKNIGQTLTDYTTMNNDLLRSENGAAFDKWFTSEFSHLKGRVTNSEWINKHKGWYDTYKPVLQRLGWINS